MPVHLLQVAMVCLCGDGSVCLALGTEIGSVFFNGIGLEDWSMTGIGLADWHWMGRWVADWYWIDYELAD